MGDSQSRNDEEGVPEAEMESFTVPEVRIPGRTLKNVTFDSDDTVLQAVENIIESKNLQNISAENCTFVAIVPPNERIWLKPTDCIGDVYFRLKNFKHLEMVTLEGQPTEREPDDMSQLGIHVTKDH